MATFIVNCDYCLAECELSKPGRFCTARHRAYFHRDALVAQRTRLAHEAHAALASGDVSMLELVARRAVDLLRP